MSTAESSVSDMMLTVKSREIQRGILAEMQENHATAERHLLAAAHLELVLAGDYAEMGQDDMALRSRLSAASCFWRAGHIMQAQSEFEALRRDYPAQIDEIQQSLSELEAQDT